MEHRKKTNQFNIALIADPVGKSGIEILTGIITVLQALAERVLVITGNFPLDKDFGPTIHIQNISTSSRKPARIPVKVFQFLLREWKLSWHLIKASSRANIIVIVGLSTTLPIVMAKLQGKKVIRIVAASLPQQVEREHGKRSPFYYAATMIERLNYTLSDRVVVLTAGDQLEPTRCRKKVVQGTLFIDTAVFRPEKRLEQRGNTVGYVGRLESIKGIMNFTQAIPLVLANRSDVEFLIGGDGSLLGKVTEALEKEGLGNKVSLTGWIPHDKLPEYLNRLRLFVLPSYSEGLPVTMLEAMSCGTPVLVTAVGMISDVIKDGGTGFILEDNSPQAIAKAVLMVLDQDQHKLEEISARARNVVGKEYSYEAAVRKYGEVLWSLRR